MPTISPAPSSQKLLQQILSPGNASNVYVILFTAPPGDASSAEWVNRLAHHAFPPSFRRLQLPWHAADPLVLYFGIRQAPVIAAIQGGSMLALVDDCDAASAQWLCQYAAQFQPHNI